MLKLFQIEITREDANRINAGERFPKWTAYQDATMLGRFPGRTYYAHVADIDTDDLETAFAIGNIGPEEKITRHARMHSVSVGDVLVNEEGEAFVVASCGFDRILKGWE